MMFNGGVSTISQGEGVQGGPRGNQGGPSLVTGAMEKYGKNKNKIQPNGFPQILHRCFTVYMFCTVKKSTIKLYENSLKITRLSLAAQMVLVKGGGCKNNQAIVVSLVV